MKFKTMFLGLIAVVILGVGIQMLNPGHDISVREPNTFVLSKRLQSQDFQINRVTIRDGRIIENKVIVDQSRLKVESGEDYKLDTIKFRFLEREIIVELVTKDQKIITFTESVELEALTNRYMCSESIQNLEFGQSYILGYASNSIYAYNSTLTDLYTQIKEGSNVDEFVVLTLQFI